MYAGRRIAKIFFVPLGPSRAAIGGGGVGSSRASAPTPLSGFYLALDRILLNFFCPRRILSLLLITWGLRGTSLRRLPILRDRSLAEGPQGSKVSIATGMEI
jgi:hypothetical protein